MLQLPLECLSQVGLGPGSWETLLLEQAPPILSSHLMCAAKLFF